ncbi:MAG TPA: 6-bladed beta-propeller, partial [Balneolales bacterium]|nr:6-bladed beta-propeller [Balneolales bacterium]
MKKFIVLFLVFVFWGCKSRKTGKIPKNIRNLKNLTVIPANAKPEYHISFQKDGSYGSTKKVMIGLIGAFSVDDSGRVYISDIQKNTIDVFNSNGNYLTHIGRKGRGPGEFEVGPYLKIVSKRLFAYDATSHRISIFSLNSFHLLQTINLKSTNKMGIKALHDTHFHQILFTNDNRFLVGFEGIMHVPQHVPKNILGSQYIHYYLMNNDGRIVTKQLFKLKDAPELKATIMGKIPFQTNFLLFRQPVVVIARNGSIFATKSNFFLIREYGPNGKYNHSIYYPYKKVPLTSKSATNVGIPDYVLKRWDSMDLPKFWPVLKNIIIDSHNRLWVSSIVKNMKMYQWWLLTPTGKLIARFDWP